MPLIDLVAFDLGTVLAKRAHEATKQAFTPSPAVEQAVMGQAQGGAPGGDPSQGAPPGGGAMDPSAMAAMQQGGAAPQDPSQQAPPPGTDPSAMAAQAAPPQGGDDPLTSLNSKLDKLVELQTQQLQQSQQGAGGKGGTGGASLKVDPNQFHHMAHKISVMESILRQLADGMGMHVPASELFDAHQMAGTSSQPPAQPSPADAKAQAQGPATGGIATKLPSLPPIATKAASHLLDLARIDAGTAVNPLAEYPEDRVVPKTNTLNILSALRKKR